MAAWPTSSDRVRRRSKDVPEVGRGAVWTDRLLKIKRIEEGNKLQ